MNYDPSKHKIYDMSNENASNNEEIIGKFET